MTPRTPVSRRQLGDRRRFTAAQIAGYVALISGTLGVLGTCIGGYRAWTGHRDADLRREIEAQHTNERRDQQIHQLQSVVGSEFPKYTPALDWVDK